MLGNREILLQTGLIMCSVAGEAVEGQSTDSVMDVEGIEKGVERERGGRGEKEEKMWVGERKNRPFSLFQ